MIRNKYIALSVLSISVTVGGLANADEAVFKKNCSACHAGGKNIMNPAKGLDMDSLKSNGVDSVDAIKTLVTKGKAPMPAFESLGEDKINSVSNYVLEQAKKGW